MSGAEANSSGPISQVAYPMSEIQFEIGKKPYSAYYMAKAGLLRQARAAPGKPTIRSCMYRTTTHAHLPAGPVLGCRTRRNGNMRRAGARRHADIHGAMMSRATRMWRFAISGRAASRPKTPARTGITAPPQCAASLRTVWACTTCAGTYGRCVAIRFASVRSDRQPKSAMPRRSRTTSIC